MFIVVEVIPFKTPREMTKLLRMNKKAYVEGNTVITKREVKWNYDDRQRRS